MSRTDQDKAFAYAHELALRVLDARIRVEGGTGDLLARRLADAELPSLMVYAGVLVRIDRGQIRRFVEDLSEPTKHSRLSPERLRQKLSPARGRRLRVPPRRAFHIVERYVRADPGVPTRARYNVACFYSSLTKRQDLKEADADGLAAARALEELDLALNDVTLLPWAEADPSLEPLQDEWSEGWKEVIGRHRLDASTDSTSKDSPSEEAPPEQRTAPGDEGQLLKDVRRATGLEVEELRLGARPDFVFEGPQGAVVVTVHTDPTRALTPDLLENAISRARWRYPDRPARVVVLVAAGTSVSPQTIESAERLGVGLYEVGPGGRLQPVRPARPH